MNPDSSDFPHNEHLDDVLQIISKLAQKAAVADYIYRGEPERYEQISSSFYRALPVKPPAGFNANDFQANTLLEEARLFTSQSDDLVILTELQHYGGKTNLIDFTADCHVALFFACDGSHDRDGRVIFLERNGNMKSHIHGPRSPVNRVIAQKSVFVMPPLGYIEVDQDDIVIIPRSLKFPILEHLRKAHGISAEKIYNDIHGFIRYEKVRQEALKHLLTGLTNLLNSDYQSAIDSFTKSLVLNPSSFASFASFAYDKRGTAKVHKGDYDGATDDYDRAIALAPNYAAAYNNRGLAKAYKSDYDGTTDDYDRAIALDPNNAAAYNNRGVAKAYKGDYDGATNDYDRAIALDPNYAAAYDNRGTAKTHKGDYDGAIADYDRAIALDPNYAAAYDNRGTAKTHKGDYDGAIADYDRAIALDPNDTAAYNNRGLAKAHKGDYDGAIDDCSRAIALDPNNANAYNNRGIAKLSKGDYDGAVDDCSRAIELEPDEAPVYSNRGEVWLHLSEWDNARDDLAIALNMGLDIVASFRNEYESVADFERRNGIAVPPDIAQMLGG